MSEGKTERSFELRADVAKDFSGGSLALGADGKTVDLKSRLDSGGGRITTSDPILADALAGHPALKEVSPETPEPAEETKKEKK